MENRKNKIKRRNVPDHMIYKLSFVFLVLALILFFLIAAIYKVISQYGDTYEKRALAQQTYVSSEIPYKRGEIQDRNGSVFARSETVYDLIISPKDILYSEEDRDSGKEVQKYLEPSLNALEKYFGYSREEIMAKLQEKSGSQYVRLEYDLPSETVEAYKTAMEEEKKAVDARNKKKGKDEKKETFVDLGNCIYFEMGYKRIYPLKTTASNVIGFATDSMTTGLEDYYNDSLTGTTGRNYGYFNSEGELERIVKPAEDGYTVVTTLDANVQQLVEKHIREFQEGEIGAERVAVVLSNPQNGEIYAMASTNSYDLNHPFDLESYTKKEIKKLLKQYYTDAQIEKFETDMKSQNESEAEEAEALYNAAVLHSIWRNYCISDAYEPGSTFKPFTVSAVLDENSATNKTTYVCDGYQMISGWSKPIRCTHVHGQISMAQTIMYSCNDALMQMAAKLGAQKFYYYEGLFGLGKKTGIDLPEEGSGRIYSLDELTAVDLAACSFGQSNTVTMMQMIAGFSSVINGGNYYVPHIMKKIVDSNGAVVETYPNEIVRKTISEETSTRVKKYLLRTVAEDGTATGARVDGYEVGGKTGTAEKIPRGEGNYLLSFLGYVGYDEPEVVIYVIIDEPHVEDQAHSSFATMFASEILEDVLPFLGIYKEAGGIDDEQGDAGAAAVPDEETGSDEGGDAEASEEDMEGDDSTASEEEESADDFVNIGESGETEASAETGSSGEGAAEVPDNNEGGTFSIFGSDETGETGEEGAQEDGEEDTTEDSEEAVTAGDTADDGIEGNE